MTLFIIVKAPLGKCDSEALKTVMGEYFTILCKLHLAIIKSLVILLEIISQKFGFIDVFSDKCSIQIITLSAYFDLQCLLTWQIIGKLLSYT